MAAPENTDTYEAFVEAPAEVIEFLELLASAGCTITGVEDGQVAVTFESVPPELFDRMNSIRMR